MKNKSLLLLLVLLLIFLIAAVPAHAQQQFKLFESPFLKAFADWLTTPVNWPPIGQEKQLVAPLAIIIVSIALFTVILAAVRRIPLFQDDNARRLATWLALPIVGISVTGTHFVPSIWGIVGFGSDITPIILFILLILFAIMLTVRGIGASGIRGGPIGQAVGERVQREAERAAGAIRGQTGREERNLAQEAQLFQGVDNLERAGVRDAAALERYISEMINLLGSGQSIRQIADGINARLGRLNATFNALVAVNARATTLDTQLNTAITTETGRLRQLMRTLLQRQRAAAGAPVARQDTALITRYTSDMQRRLNDARTNSVNMAANGPRLTALEAQIRARLAAGLAAVGNPALPFPQRARTARTEFTQAGALTSELVTIMTTIEREAERIRNDLMAELRDVNAEDHLARAGVI